MRFLESAILKCLATLFVVHFRYDSGVGAVPCYDFFTGEAKPCYPQPVNAATERNITATNTCGSPKSTYCEIGPGKLCFECDAASTMLKHPARYMVDVENPLSDVKTWWQSQTWWDTNQLGISKIGEPLKVNITVHLGKTYHISGKVRVTFHSERPRALVIERSSDHGVSWQPYQYFAKDCLATYNMPPIETPPADDPFKVTCTEEYSHQYPSKDGIMEFQTYTRYSPEDYLEPHIQAYMKATHVRLRLEYPGTDGSEAIDSEETLNRYYYAISDVRVDGRCDCHGHAEYCDGSGMDQYCSCEHHTAGVNCERCAPLYNNRPWLAGNKTHPNECQKCDCNGHADACSYDHDMKSGRCYDCIHNTRGDRCEYCVDGYYRDPEKKLDAEDVCLPCDCFATGITDNGTCLQQATGDAVLGQCNCKENVFGRRCDECVPGFWGFRVAPEGHCQDCACNLLGTIDQNNNCDQQTGECTCKFSVQGEKCTECVDGFYSFPNKSDAYCLKCPCDLGGALKTCGKEQGECHCRPNIEGQVCDAPMRGYFVPSLDYLLYEAEHYVGEEQVYLEESSEYFTGRGYALFTSTTPIQFTGIMVDIPWHYYIAVRYTSDHLPDNITIRVDGASVTGEVVVPGVDLGVGSGQALTTESPIYLGNVEWFNITLTMRDSVDDGFVVDSLILMPDMVATRVYTESHSESVMKLEECYANFAVLSSRKDIDSSCEPLLFSLNAEIYNGALPCACNEHGASQLDNCDANGGQCQCHHGVGGHNCDYCLAGHYGFGEDQPCPACECSIGGATSSICDIITGTCECKTHTEGPKCNICKQGTFNLDEHNVNGCQSCFGYGHGTVCDSATGFIASSITSDFTDSGHNWKAKGNPDLLLNVDQNGLAITEDQLTLVAPSKFLGNRLKSYQQHFVIKVTSDAVHKDIATINIVGYGIEATLTPSLTPFADYVELRYVMYDPDMTEYQFQSMLSDVTSVELTLRGPNLVLSEISLETAILEPVPHDGAVHVTFVENVTCHENYTGLSCQFCAPGFTRVVANSGPFSECVRCSCNDRAVECDPESGVCLGCAVGSTGDYCEECEYHVVGPYCNICADGFYGLSNDDRNCMPCDCYLPGTVHGNSSSCNSSTGQCLCDESLHTGGLRCNVCQENAWNRSESLICEECPPCFGMIRDEVDGFRDRLAYLYDDFSVLVDLPIFSVYNPFSASLAMAGEKTSSLVARSLELTQNQSEVVKERERLAQLLYILELASRSDVLRVSVTVDSVATVIDDYNHLMGVLNATRALVRATHAFLTGAGVVNPMDQLRGSVDDIQVAADNVETTRAGSEAKLQDLVTSSAIVGANLVTANDTVTRLLVEMLTLDDRLGLLTEYVMELQSSTANNQKSTDMMVEMAHQRYDNASSLYNATTRLSVADTNLNISQAMVKLNQLSTNVTDRALLVLTAIENHVEQDSPIISEIYQTLEKLRMLEVKAAMFGGKTAALLSQAAQYHVEAQKADMEASELVSSAQDALDMSRGFEDIVSLAKDNTAVALHSIAQLTTSNRNHILLAINVTIAIENTYDRSRGLPQLADSALTNAMMEQTEAAGLYSLSVYLVNNTSAARVVTDRRDDVTEYIATTATPLNEKCSALAKLSHESVENTTAAFISSERLLEKVHNVSQQVKQLTHSMGTLPALDTTHLTNMRADIARLRSQFDALNLSDNLETLRRGKQAQGEWLEFHKLKLQALRSKIALAQNFRATLSTRHCS